MKKHINLDVVVLALLIIAYISAAFSGFVIGEHFGWENGFSSAVSIYHQPATDSEIWETYHDCDMYGLPEYAREQCNK
jgi:hypothetical protein